MAQRINRFRVLQKQVSGPLNDDGTLLGVVKVQMPEQCGRDFKIRRRERARNMTIVQNVITRFGNWAREVDSPAIILFPEFSISTETTDWLIDQMPSEHIAPNTLIVFGIEQITTTKFMDYVANSESRDDFDGAFGPNINLINTGVILTKDNYGSVACYFQPKCSRSDYELDRQFVSSTVNLIEFGPYHLVVSVCSDFLLRDDGQPLVGALLHDIGRLHERPRDHRLDLVLLIQKNPSPLHDLYNNSIQHLFLNRPHLLDTSGTIICAVNAADPNNPAKLGRCNVSVMARGRPPKQMHRVSETYAWCSFKDHENLHYARWRLRLPGTISFVLDTDRRPWQLGDRYSVPIRNCGLHRLSEAGQVEEVIPIPEVYEIQDVLYRGFQAFVDQIFQSPALRNSMRSLNEYEAIINQLFVQCPSEIIRILLSLHTGIPDNCDQWDMAQVRDVFTYFLLTLRLLSIRYPDLQIPEDYLFAEGSRMGVVDCDGRVDADIIYELRDPNTVPNIDVLFLQRISKLILWDGKPTTLDNLKNLLSANRVDDAIERSDSVARVPSPQVAHVGSLVADLNLRCERFADVKGVLNEVLQFA